MENRFILYVDADSCPREIRQIILRAVTKREIPSLFVANRELPDVVELEKRNLKTEGGFSLVTMIVVENKDASADNKIVELAQKNSIAITRDIPLADRLVSLGLTVLDDRGSVFTQQNIKERLSLRNLMTKLRQDGLYIERTNALSSKEIQGFANALDRELTKIEKHLKQKRV
ncbi:MAG: DUF188 domain-containing protein [Sphaerochaetaceae bacterium]